MARDRGVPPERGLLLLDVAWVSSWNDQANRLLAPLLGIPPLPVVPMPAPPFEPARKVPLVAAYARPPRGSTICMVPRPRPGRTSSEPAQKILGLAKHCTLLITE